MNTDLDISRKQSSWVPAFAGMTLRWCRSLIRPRTRSPDRTGRVQPEVEIIVHRLHQLRHFVREEMVGAGDGVVMDGDVLLGAKLVDQLLDGARSHHLVAFALDDDA